MMELKFSEEMQRQIDTITNTKRPDDATNTRIKFDAKGTLHNRSYNSEGKLLKDVPLKERTIEEARYTAAIREEDINNDLSRMQINNRRNKTAYYALLIGVGALLALSIITIRMIGVMYGG